MPRPASAAGQLISLGRRGYAAEVQRRGSSMAARISAVEGGGAAGAAAAAAAAKEIFWMRDPKTGCWVPENRFGDVDAAELRARLLSRKG
ncbi:protein SENESCENCE-ASSOCIATED GENE 21, mitochondrial-like [Oryza brachyantha]|uniref:protein SENESCENCE-ASSOCIATED GENE 21, mitochondrial-like n=1 Tax=Oryza brachyantha TaxID=4533 RepID=UPI001ADA3CF5|nr:protein SENESCENCE-ASSOCIATED GENE 21, mitochondrial-like [Oryza brachyantha]